MTRACAKNEKTHDQKAIMIKVILDRSITQQIYIMQYVESRPYMRQ